MAVKSPPKFPDWFGGAPAEDARRYYHDLTDAQMIAWLGRLQAEAVKAWLEAGMIWVNDHSEMERVQADKSLGRGATRDAQITMSKATGQCLRRGYWLRHLARQIKMFKARIAERTERI